MTADKCSSCNKAKATLHCGVCQTSLCKYCAQILDENDFSFCQNKPIELKHSIFCNHCYDAHIALFVEKYNQTLQAAKEVIFFLKKQSKETRLIRRTERPFRVVNCKDYDEAILRMAFFAVENNFNAVVDVDLSSKKSKNGSYQTTTWSGSGVPANVDPRWLPKDRSLWQNPN